MRVNWAIAPVSIGWILALIVLLVVIVLVVTHAIDTTTAFLIGALAVARLL